MSKFSSTDQHEFTSALDRTPDGVELSSTVRQAGWRDLYTEAYQAANGEEATVVEGKDGYFRITAASGFTTDIPYTQTQIEAMTNRLLERASERNTPDQSDGMPAHSQNLQSSQEKS